MPTNPQSSSSVYEADLRDRRGAGEARRFRQRVISEQRNDVESAISLDLQARRLEKQIALYDDPSSGFPGEISRAKRARQTLWTLVIAYVFIGFVDFWLATPDVAETLANKAMAMVPQSAAMEGDVTSVTPVWLRICVGITLTLGFLAATFGLKKLSDPADQREAIAALQPGDDQEFRDLQRMIWAKRGLKVAYMLVLVGLFSHLYSYDLERARMMEEVRSMQQEEFEWTDLGVSLTGGELSTNEAIPSATVATSGADSSSSLAKPALVIYCLLWILHGILVLLPNPTRDVDLGLAGFKRVPAGQKADGLREREGQVLRDILLRINESDDDIREALIREAQPVAARANEAARRAAMEVPTNPSVSPAFAANAQMHQGGNVPNMSHDTPGAADDGFGRHDTTTRFQANDDEDPYSTIFGQPA